jgi:arsenical pump membrane protein
VQWIVLGIVVATLVTIVARPRGIGEAWPAAIGGASMLLLGAVTPREAGEVLHQTADILLFLLGMMVLTWLAERAGVFEWLAESMARLARGSGPLLYGLVFLLAAVVTALLSLDVTVLILTPIIYALSQQRRLDAIPFVFACTFVANTGSLFLPISNLTNLLVYSQFRIDFLAFATTMWFPNLVAVLTNLLLFFWIFKGQIPRRFIRRSSYVTPTTWWFHASAATLTVTLVALLLSGLARLPLAWAALGGGAVLLAISLLGGQVRLPEVNHAISWPLFIFVIGMFLVVRGFEETWLETLRVALPRDPLPALLLAVGGTTIGSNVVNNVPMTLLALPFIGRAPEPVRDIMAYGALVGANIGPTLTTYGSLATMLWLTLIRKRGVFVSTTMYMRVALFTTPIVLFTTTIALWLVLR